MLRIRTWLPVTLVVGMICGPQIGRADTRVADPGFAYVDVNNDGMYSASDGDIQVPASLLQAGSFDTSSSKKGYKPPSKPASLVIPASQTLSLTGTLTLKADVNLSVFGNLSASSITLKAAKNTDVTASVLTVADKLTVDATCDAILSGATITATNATSTVSVTAGNNVIGNQAIVGGNTLVAAALAGQSITIKASNQVQFDEAAMLVTASATSTTPASTITVNGANGVAAVDFAAFLSQGETKLESKSGKVDFSNGFALAGSITIDADGDATIQGAALDSGGSVTVKADGNVTGNASTAISAGSLKVAGDSGVDLSDVAVISSPGAIGIDSANGTVALNNASIITAGGLSATAGLDLSCEGLSLLADNYTKLIAEGGVVSADGSTIRPYTSAVTDTYLRVRAKDAINASSVNWTSDDHITVHSVDGNVDLSSSTLNATGPSAPLNLYAGGGTLTLTGATLTGVQKIGPHHVTVIH